MIRRIIETIQTTVLLKSARILKRVTCCHSSCSEKPPVKTDVKNSHREK